MEIVKNKLKHKKYNEVVILSYLAIHPPPQARSGRWGIIAFFVFHYGFEKKGTETYVRILCDIPIHN